MAVWPLCLSFFLLFALDASEAAPLTGTGDAESVSSNNFPSVFRASAACTLIPGTRSAFHGQRTCPLVRQATCETESGWSAYEGRCFRFFNFQRSWIDAEKQCLGYDGNLASVHSYDEYIFIQDLIKSQTQASTLSWIGGYDAVSEGNWLWSDGSKLNLEIWAPPQPDNWNGVEHCLEMNYHSYNSLKCYQCVFGVFLLSISSFVSGNLQLIQVPPVCFLEYFIFQFHLN